MLGLNHRAATLAALATTAWAVAWGSAAEAQAAAGTAALALPGSAPQELELVKLGLTDGVLKRDKKVADLDSYGPKLQQLVRTRMANVAAASKKAAQPFLEKAAAEKGAERTASGLVYSELKAGTGDTPKPTDVVKVNYEGRLMDGTVFDRSRGTPASFPLNGVIKCWTEGLQKMKVGGKAKLVCPADIAYGDTGSPPLIKPGVPLVFEVELLEIVKK